MMLLTCQSLIQAYPQVWHDATTHPFLAACKSGRIRPQQFNTWLVQDYLFVNEFTRMVATALTAAPIHHFDVLLSGLTALKDELEWFRTKAAERDLNLNTPAQATCLEYCRLMHSFAEADYVMQATALWAIELAYNQGWQRPGLMPEPYAEFADRWGNAGFTAYVQQLERQADEVLARSPDSLQAQARDAFLTVARLERGFWQMAFSSPDHSPNHSPDHSPDVALE